MIGSQAEAESIKLKIKDFLHQKLGLQLHRDKTKITYARKEFAEFLGALIAWRANTDKKVILKKRGNTER